MRTDTVIGQGSAYASVGFENLFERSNDGRIVQTMLPDGSKVVGYREKKELLGYNKFITNNIHIVFFEDGSVSKVVDDGEVVFVSAVDRHTLNLKGEKKQSNDVDYWLQLFGLSEERREGVFTASLRD